MTLKTTALSSLNMFILIYFVWCLSKQLKWCGHQQTIVESIHEKQTSFWCLVSSLFFFLSLSLSLSPISQYHFLLKYTNRLRCTKHDSLYYNAICYSDGAKQRQQRSCLFKSLEYRSEEGNTKWNEQEIENIYQDLYINMVRNKQYKIEEFRSTKQIL